MGETPDGPPEETNEDRSRDPPRPSGPPSRRYTVGRPRAVEGQKGGLEFSDRTRRVPLPGHGGSRGSRETDPRPFIQSWDLGLTPEGGCRK